MTDKKQREVFGRNLSDLIEMTGRKQHEVADDLDVPHTTFNTWCVGRVVPSVKVLHELADYFHCSILDLIDEHDAGFEYRYKIIRLFRSHNEINYMKRVLAYLQFSRPFSAEWSRRCL